MGERHTSANVQHSVLEGHCSKLLESLHSQWQDKTYCDLEIKAKDGAIAVHACVLSAFSPKIASIVLKQAKKKNIQVGRSPLYTVNVKFTFKVMKVILDALYTGVFQAPSTGLDEVSYAVRWLRITSIVDIKNRHSDNLRPNVEKNNSGLQIQQIQPSESSNATIVPGESIDPVKDSDHSEAKPGYMKTRFINKRRPSTIVQNKSKAPCKGTLVTQLLQYPVKIEVDIADEESKVVLEDTTNNHENEPKNELNNVNSEPAKKCYHLFDINYPLDKQAKVCPPLQGLTENSSKCKNQSKMKHPESKEMFKGKKTETKIKNSAGELKKKQGSAVKNKCTIKVIESVTVKETEKGAVKEMFSGEVVKGTKDIVKVTECVMSKEMDSSIPPAGCLSVLREGCSDEATAGVTMTTTVIEEVNDSDPVKMELDAIVESVKPIKCSKCFEKFTDPDVYNNHINNHPTFHCKECGQVFHRKFNLTRHFRIEHLGREYLKCRLCGHQAKDCSELRRHSTTEHNDPKPFYCTFEGCAFKQMKYSTVVSHMRIHSNEREYTCEKCGLKFVAANSLSSHQRTCYNLQQFLCDLCGQSFNHQQSMKKHRAAIHFGEKPYKCKVCFDSFGDHRNLSRHMRIHNNIFPYPCHLCKQKFRHSNTRKAHLASCHKASDTCLVNLSTAGNKHGSVSQKHTSKTGKFTGVISRAADKSKKKRRKKSPTKKIDAPSPTQIYQSSSLTDEFIIPPHSNFDASNSSGDLAVVMEGSHQLDNFSFISKPSELYVDTGTDSDEASGSRFHIDADSFDNLLDKSPFYSPSSSPYNQTRGSAFSPLAGNIGFSNEGVADRYLPPTETAVKGQELLPSLAWPGKIQRCPDASQSSQSLLLPTATGKKSFLELPALTGTLEHDHPDDPHLLFVQKPPTVSGQLTAETVPSPRSFAVPDVTHALTSPSLDSDSESLHQIKYQAPVNLNLSIPSSNLTSLQTSTSLVGGMNNLTVAVITPDGKTLGHVIFKGEQKT